VDSSWMTEEYGIPHKNGMVRFYMIGIDEDVSKYLGWYDMTDWETGWNKVWTDAQATQQGQGNASFQIVRHDQLEDLARNVQMAFFEALEDKDETTFLWWYRKTSAKREKKVDPDEEIRNP